MLQERNERCGDRRDLSGRHVHELHLFRSNHGEVGVQTRFDTVTHERAVLAQRRVALGYDVALLDFGGQIDHFVIVEVDTGILDLAVGSLDESQIIDLGIHAKRRDQTDVGAFRSLDRTQTSVVGIVHVAHLEAGTLTRQTAGTQGRHAALVGDFGQRVCLVHELAQSVCAEECVDHRRDGLGIDQVDGSEDFVVAHVHAFADGAAHAGQTHAELIVELLAHGAHTTVRQVVDVVHIGLGVDQLDQIFDDGDDVFLGEHMNIHRSAQIELLVDAVTAHLSEIIALLGEEKVGDDLACARVIRRLRVAQLPVDILYGLLFGV